jgi:hypothetical protein
MVLCMQIISISDEFPSYLHGIDKLVVSVSCHPSPPPHSQPPTHLFLFSKTSIVCSAFAAMFQTFGLF